MASVVAGIKPLSAALKERDHSLARQYRARLREVEAQLAEILATCELGQEPGVLDLLDWQADAADLNLVCGVVCELNLYVATRGFQRVLGHRETRGANCADPRFVDPADLEMWTRVARKSRAQGCRGERVIMKTVEGLRMPGQAWSLPTRMHGERGYRLFAVLLEGESIPPVHPP